MRSLVVTLNSESSFCGIFEGDADTELPRASGFSLCSPSSSVVLGCSSACAVMPMICCTIL